MRELRGNELRQLLVAGNEQRRARQLVDVREAQNDPVVGVRRLHFEAGATAQHVLDGERPRGMYARAEGREYAHAPVAQLVAKTLDRDRPISRQCARVLALFVDVGGEVRRGVRVDRHARARESRGRVARKRSELTHPGADGAPQLDRASRSLAAPERQAPGLARRGRYVHAVSRDGLHAPRARPEHDRIARPRLEDHLLVQLADARAALTDVHAVIAAIGNRAAGDARQQRGAAACAQALLGVIPAQPRAQVREVRGRIAAGEHLEHAGQRFLREIGVAVGAPHRAAQLRDRARAVAAHGDDLLSEHVERVARHAGRLDVGGEHALRNDGALEQVAAEFRIDARVRRLADAVARPAHALEAARHRARRLDEQHLIDSAHVDAQLERAGRDEAAQRACLEGGLDLRARLVRDAAMVRAHDRFARERVQALA